jgi:hypothetical protein
VKAFDREKLFQHLARIEVVLHDQDGRAHD